MKSDTPAVVDIVAFELTDKLSGRSRGMAAGMPDQLLGRAGFDQF